MFRGGLAANVNSRPIRRRRTTTGISSAMSESTTGISISMRPNGGTASRMPTRHWCFNSTAWIRRQGGHSFSSAINSRKHSPLHGVTLSGFERQWHPALRLKSYDGDNLLLDVTMPHSGWLTFVDNWDPFWTAAINGNATSISRLLGSYKASVRAGRQFPGPILLSTFHLATVARPADGEFRFFRPRFTHPTHHLEDVKPTKASVCIRAVLAWRAHGGKSPATETVAAAPGTLPNASQWKTLSDLGGTGQSPL